MLDKLPFGPEEEFKNILTKNEGNGRFSFSISYVSWTDDYIIYIM